tara:strand:+ start:26554 stop:26811 length:258 start_codon:yes stop_codon:yes gene_type:complete
MPRYKYYCDLCLEIFDVWHGMNETLSECKMCNATDSLTRVPSMVSDYKPPVETKKTGDLTNEFIEKNKQQLAEMKKELKNKGIEK